MKNSLKLAFRISLLFGRRVLVPFTSYTESEICREIVDEHHELFKYGVFDLTGSSLTVGQALEQAEAHYEKNPKRLQRYRQFKSDYLPPYVVRKESATAQLVKRWNEFAQVDDPAKHFGNGDALVQSAIERNWGNVTSSIGGGAMIAENVARLLFDGRRGKAEEQSIESLMIFLGDEYFSGVSKEFDACVFDNVPYMSNTLIWGSFEKLDYRNYINVLGAQLTNRLIRTDPNLLLEEIQKLREMMMGEGLLQTI